jgi:putative MATE family efflux protein
MDKARSDLLGKTDVKKALISLTIPATIAMIVTGLYNLVDTIFVGQGVSEDAIGALGIANPVQMIIMAFSLMIGIGSASIFSRAYGRKDKETMHRAVNTALFMGIVFSVLVAGLGLYFLEDMLRLFGATNQNIGYAVDYLRIILIGLIPFSLQVILNNLVRAEGRAKVAMISMLIGAGTNIVLDPIFIFDWGLNLGVQGAALATVISRIFAFIYVFGAAISKNSKLDIRLKNLHQIDIKMFVDVSAIGFSSFVRNALGALLVVVINNLILSNAINAEAATTYQSMFSIVNRVALFLLMPGFGLIQGLQPVVGYNYGAGLFKRLYDVIKYALKLILIYFGVIFVIIQVFAGQLILIFSKVPSDLLISEGPRAMRIVALAYGIIGFQIILSSVYQAMGYPIRAFLVAASRQFILFLPIVAIFAHFFGIEGIWWTFFVADFVASAVSALVYRYEMKLLYQKIPQNI